MKIAHIFYTTIPGVMGGDIRSRDVIESQRDLKIDVVAISSPFQAPASESSMIEIINGITYHRSYAGSKKLHVSDRDQGIWIKLRKLAKIVSFARFVLKTCTVERADIVHAHSTFFCAIAGLYASWRLQLPLIYEVRSLWEERSVVVAPSIRTKVISRIIRQVETLCCRLADHVVVISEGLHEEMRSRGIPESKLTTIGNAVNLARVNCNEPTCLSKDPNNWIFGYVGNIGEVEGLDLLIDAIKQLRSEGWGNPVHIYGTGPVLDDLARSAAEVSGVKVCGPFKPNDAPDIYKSLDIIVNPRRRSNLTEKVTPLKPLEAMAWRKPVLASNVGGMLELIRDKKTGFLFEADNVDSLASELRFLTTAPDLLPSVITTAFQFVYASRSWSANANKYKKLYSQLATNSAPKMQQNTQ